MSYWWRNKSTIEMKKTKTCNGLWCVWVRLTHPVCPVIVQQSFSEALMELNKLIKNHDETEYENDCTETNEESDINIHRSTFFSFRKLVCECIQSSGFHYLLPHKLSLCTSNDRSNDWNKNQVPTKINHFHWNSVYSAHSCVFFFIHIDSLISLEVFGKITAQNKPL